MFFSFLMLRRIATEAPEFKAEPAVEQSCQDLYHPANTDLVGVYFFVHNRDRELTFPGVGERYTVSVEQRICTAVSGRTLHC